MDARQRGWNDKIPKANRQDGKSTMGESGFGCSEAVLPKCLEDTIAKFQQAKRWCDQFFARGMLTHNELSIVIRLIREEEGQQRRVVDHHEATLQSRPSRTYSLQVSPAFKMGPRREMLARNRCNSSKRASSSSEVIFGFSTGQSMAAGFPRTVTTNRSPPSVTRRRRSLRWVFASKAPIVCIAY